MGMNKISGTTNAYGNTPTSKVKTGQGKITDKVAANKSDVAAVYEKNDNVKEEKKVYKRDTATIDRMLEEAEKRTQSLRDLVEKMMLKQGQTLQDSTDIYQLLREGKLEVDPETRAQAQKDIAEDGYWGVEQTSERLVSFAKALAGGDPSKADIMIKAVKKGFEQATKTWGDELPEISKNTLDTTISKLEDWSKALHNE